MIAENVKKEGLYLSIRYAQMQYRHEIEHAPAMFAPVGEGTGKVKDVRSDAVWACNRGTLPLCSPLWEKEQEKLKMYALMQYRSIFGARSR